MRSAPSSRWGFHTLYFTLDTSVVPDTETWTVGRLLAWTQDYLASRGADSPRLDAEVLLAEALGCQRIDLYTRFDDVPDDAPRSLFRELIQRRAKHVPVAYLVGRREFYSLSFRVTPEVLIPRPETELLVVAALDRAREYGDGGPVTICDVGTGSGAIAVCLAKHLPRARVTAVDLSAAALGVAQANAQRHGVAERIRFVESDLLDALPAELRFDLVVSNPPYVKESEWAELVPEVREHEPRAALVAGQRGTEVIERLLPQAAAYLKPAGHLLLEIGPMIHEAVCTLIEADPNFGSPVTTKDLARLPRIVQAKKREKTSQNRHSEQAKP
ncbi:MAG: peptide chain release factor N(5)-glutamine methyltransferase [Pirellulales bacterium]|nr:peptide chain release factor N(5)-glutamine methyltransferase [Pirellulales bacterium]